MARVNRGYNSPPDSAHECPTSLGSDRQWEHICQLRLFVIPLTETAGICFGVSLCILKPFTTIYEYTSTDARMHILFMCSRGWTCWPTRAHIQAHVHVCVVSEWSYRRVAFMQIFHAFLIFLHFLALPTTCPFMANSFLNLFPGETHSACMLTKDDLKFVYINL